MTTHKVDEPLRNQHGTSARKVSSGYLWIAAAAIAGLGIAIVAPPQKMIFYNPSASAPRGWYVRVPLRDLTPGQWVLLDFPDAMATTAAERHYLPLGVPALKRIAAGSGDEVCERRRLVEINRRIVAVALARDRAGRPLPAWEGCRTLQRSEVFLLNTLQLGSFDSRYFGPIGRESILGRAIPIWTEEGS